MSTNNKQKKPNVFDDRKVGEYLNGENLFFGALFSGVSGVIGLLGMVGGMAIDESSGL